MRPPGAGMRPGRNHAAGPLRTGKTAIVLRIWTVGGSWYGLSVEVGTEGVEVGTDYQRRLVRTLDGSRCTSGPRTKSVPTYQPPSPRYQLLSTVRTNFHPLGTDAIP